MKVMLIAGARPNFMKVAPIIRAIEGHNAKTDTSDHIESVLVHTGQHYDALMSDSFFHDLALPAPKVNLGIGSGSHAVQTAGIMRAIEDVLLSEKPQVLIVVGDVNSTIACALVAAKISYDERGTRPLIAHVEAGLRSFDRTMPEEINRVLTDQISDILFVTEDSAVENLKREGVSPAKIHFVGNTMIDTLLSLRRRSEQSHILDTFGLTNGTSSTVPYALVTLHRPSNVDNRDPLVEILGALKEVAVHFPVLWPVHPRTRNRLVDYNVKDFNDCLHEVKDAIQVHESESRVLPNKINLILPVGYIDFLSLMSNARIVLTDSGGIQEETTCLGVPCITIRENTERPVTITEGTNVLAGTSKEAIMGAFKKQMARERRAVFPRRWDGRAAERIVETLLDIGQRYDSTEADC